MAEHERGRPGEKAASNISVSASLTEAAAARLTTLIQLRLGLIADNVEQVLLLIEEAKNGNAHTALGYRSWGEYVADRFAGQLTRLSRAERLPLVALLTGTGMSTRAIAPIVGVSQRTVVDDVSSSAHVAPDLGVQPAAADATPVELAPVTGLDGKTYARTEPRKPNREPLPDRARRLGSDIDKAVNKVGGLLADDRFARNEDTVANQLRPPLLRAVATATAALDRLPAAGEGSFRNSYTEATIELLAAVRRLEGFHADDRLSQYRDVLHRFNGQRLDGISTTIQGLRDDLGGGGSS